MAQRYDITTQELARIGQLGFRKWYEKQLIESHLWLVTAFLCLIVIAVGFELVAAKIAQIGLIAKALLIVAGAAVGWIAFKRYSSTMILAESLGYIVPCPACGYPSFSVVKHERPQAKTGEPRLGHDLNQDGLLVSCRSCHHRWRWGYGDRSNSSGSESKEK